MGRAPRWWGCRDHPRIRGEHMSPQALPPRVMGSSPHTRGALFVGDTARKLRRIIPAYAGSTECQIMSAGDHPRIRGEHSVSWLQSSLHWGSSPHTRGAPGRSSPKRPRWRIIPAYAGSTSGRRGMERHGRDHPRIRGEHLMRPWPNTTKAGSSPHTRGALPGHDPTADRSRIIPAYAGSTTEI